MMSTCTAACGYLLAYRIRRQLAPPVPQPAPPCLFLHVLAYPLIGTDTRVWLKKKICRSQLVEQETDPTRPPPRYLCVQPLQAVLYRPLSAALMKRVAVTYTRKLLAGHLAMQALIRR